MTNEQKTLVSGIKPTGRVHVGNYFGAMRQNVNFANEYHSFIFIANYHALTGTPEAEILANDSINIVIDYLALGLDPEKCTLFLQSDVPEHTELALILGNLVSVSRLQRAHAYKDAKEAGKETNLGLFSYPILMAADILMYDADVVPAGYDQTQHIEMTRDLAESFNRVYGVTFKLPEQLVPSEVATVPGTDGRKMSKSYGNTIPLFATDEEIKHAVMSIVTDSKGAKDPKNPDECNIFALHKLFSTKEIDALKKRYCDGDIGYKESKDILVANIIAFVSPFRERRAELVKDEESVKEILRIGGGKARLHAASKMEEVRRKIGVSF